MAQFHYKTPELDQTRALEQSQSIAVRARCLGLDPIFHGGHRAIARGQIGRVKPSPEDSHTAAMRLLQVLYGMQRAARKPPRQSGRSGAHLIESHSAGMREGYNRAVLGEQVE